MSNRWEISFSFPLILLFRWNVFIKLLAICIFVNYLFGVYTHFLTASLDIIIKGIAYVFVCKSCDIKKFKIFIQSNISPLHFLLRKTCLPSVNTYLKQTLILLLPENIVILKTIVCKFYQNFVFSVLKQAF